MISPAELAPPFAPLPVRARGTLEIFDTAFKLFRRYAKVLLAWSAIAGIINIVPIVGIFGFILTMPLVYGSVSCAVAGAVRGQDITFKQVWGFTKPRYGALLGVLILALILLSIVSFAVLLVGTLGFGLVVAGASNYGTAAQVVATIVVGLASLVGGSLLLAVVMGWFNLAPVIACLEDGNRGSNALSRAWMLLSGNWRKASAVATILALAGTAAMLVVFSCVMFFFYGGWDKMLGASTDWASGLALSGISALFFIAWAPLQAIIGAVFYLDLRTRKEALDLEWTNYAAKPETLPVPVQAAPPPQPQLPMAPSPAPVGGAAPSAAPMPPPPPLFAASVAPSPPSVTLPPPSVAPSPPSVAPSPPSVIAPQTFNEVSPPPVIAPMSPVIAPPPPLEAPPLSALDRFAAEVEAARESSPAPAPTATSSFAPPRFRRERTSDEKADPSSFGGGAR